MSGRGQVGVCTEVKCRYPSFWFGLFWFSALKTALSFGCQAFRWPVLAVRSHPCCSQRLRVCASSVEKHWWAPPQCRWIFRQALVLLPVPRIFLLGPAFVMMLMSGVESLGWNCKGKRWTRKPFKLKCRRTSEMEDITPRQQTAW